jgi:hypothetical protein
MRWPRARFTVRRMMVVVVVIALALATMTWFIRVINEINRGLHDFYGPGGTLEREYRGELGSGAKSK